MKRTFHPRPYSRFDHQIETSGENMNKAGALLLFVAAVAIAIASNKQPEKPETHAARELPPIIWQTEEPKNPMLAALIQTESGGNPNALSSKGAAGIAQIMPETARNPGYGVKPLQDWDGKDPRTAPIEEQIRFANDLLNAMQEHHDNNPVLAAASYNAGPGAVQKALKKAKGDQHKAIKYLPAETRAYVVKVAGYGRPQQVASIWAPVEGGK